jgi:phosphinothricin acetyltransferase
MALRVATPEDAEALAAIYDPVVADTAISFELEPPGPDEMRRRIVATLARLPWLVSVDAQGCVDGYAYASRHRERAAYQWAVDVSAYVREDARGRGLGKCLYERLLAELAALGYFQACAGIALPNAASVALHEAVGFRPVGVYPQIGFKLGRWRDVGWWVRPLQAAGTPRGGAPPEPRAFQGLSEPGGAGS